MVAVSSIFILLLFLHPIGGQRKGETTSKMGRKKGKQCGSHNSKRQNAEYHHKLYVDHASEANMYRNPVSRNMLGKGLGYRNATAPIENIGRWDSSGRSCHGDKWSSIFANRSSSSQMTTRPINGIGITHENQNAARGLAHLRHLLEERRTEDRFHDRCVNFCPS